MNKPKKKPVSAELLLAVDSGKLGIGVLSGAKHPPNGFSDEDFAIFNMIQAIEQIELYLQKVEEGRAVK